MPIDPTGTSPQAVPQVNDPEELNMKCKQCPSITAIEVKYPGQGGRRLYRCVKCNFTWGLNVGGYLDI